MKNPDWTTIAVPKKLRDRLKHRGTCGDSIASVIERLLDEVDARVTKPMENLPLGNQDNMAFKIKQ